ncbi:hypothetical protein [uncultured Pseudoteredinibacter sp.]|uniref:hypothetical protein n=1 Tax=uncultured Pseudoteredinibacter sp. TaxID=1641701 RepID=UPI00260CD256|nr:hypothetical protein [uncultured Pseudoteredinibacter sp.]
MNINLRSKILVKVVCAVFLYMMSASSFSSGNNVECIFRTVKFNHENQNVGPFLLGDGRLDRKEVDAFKVIFEYMDIPFRAKKDRILVPCSIYANFSTLMTLTNYAYDGVTVSEFKSHLKGKETGRDN